MASIIVCLGLLAHIARVDGTEIPMLVLANDVSPLLANDVSPLLAAGVSVMILAGISTTAVPLLWTVSSRFYSDEKPGFKCLTLALATVGTVVGLVIPFSQMVNVVYVINGYVGILLLVLMLVKTGRRLILRRALVAARTTRVLLLPHSGRRRPIVGETACQLRVGPRRAAWR